MNEIETFKSTLHENKCIKLPFVGQVGLENVYFLIEAFSKSFKRKNVHLAIIGDGPERKTVEKSHDFGLKQYITFTGYLNKKDVLVHITQLTSCYFLQKPKHKA